MSNHPGRASSRAPCCVPRPAEVRRMQERASWSDQRCADACCVPAETWRAWTRGDRPMPAGAWKLLRYELGLLERP